MSSSLNHDEVGQIASWLRTGNATPNPPTNIDALTDACAALSKATNAPRICVTMAAAGAALWDRDNLVLAPAPKVIVKDTVGAGDAFMAGLMLGLTRGVDTQTVVQLLAGWALLSRLTTERRRCCLKRLSRSFDPI
jgi:fructokinase